MAASLNVVLISTYDLGHQPYSIALVSALLNDVGASVCCNDLAVDEMAHANAQLIFIGDDDYEIMSEKRRTRSSQN